MASKLKKQELEELIKEIVQGFITEMSTTGGVAGYNTPFAFSKKGGSKKASDSSKKFGFSTTPEGEEEMNQDADKLY